MHILERSFKCVPKKIINFIKCQSLSPYLFIAGNSVTNIIRNEKIEGDIDFFCNLSNRRLYSVYKNMILSLKNNNINVIEIKFFHCFVEIITDLIIINLISVETNPYETVKQFDLDYCKSYIDNEDLQIKTFELRTITEKKLYMPVKLQKRRMIKAIKYGYRMSNTFLFNNIEYIKKEIKCVECNKMMEKMRENFCGCKNSKKIKDDEIIICVSCGKSFMEDKNRVRICNHIIFENNVCLDDLYVFNENIEKCVYSNIKDVTRTLNEMKEYIKENQRMFTNRMERRYIEPVLINLLTDEIQEKYILSIVRLIKPNYREEYE